MTILGIASEADAAVVWTDTEMFFDGEPTRRDEPKLHANPAGFVVLGYGSAALIRAIRPVADRARDFTALALQLPQRLRAARADLDGRLRLIDARWSRDTALVAVGYDAGLGRMMAHTFDSGANFEPEWRSSFFAPELSAPFFASMSVTDVVARAREQVDRVRKRSPDATGGDLHIARVTRDRVERVVVPDFYSAGVMPRG